MVSKIFFSFYLYSFCFVLIIIQVNCQLPSSSYGYISPRLNYSSVGSNYDYSQSKITNFGGYQASPSSLYQSNQYSGDYPSTSGQGSAYQYQVYHDNPNGSMEESDPDYDNDLMESENPGFRMLGIVLFIVKKIKKIKKIKLLKIAKFLSPLLGPLLLPIFGIIAIPILLIIAIPFILLFAFMMPMPIIAVQQPTEIPMTSSTTNNIPTTEPTTEGYSRSRSSYALSRLSKTVLESENCLERIICELEKEKDSNSLHRYSAEDWLLSAVEQSPSKDKYKDRIEALEKEEKVCLKYPCKQLITVKRVFKWY